MSTWRRWARGVVYAWAAVAVASPAAAGPVESPGEFTSGPEGSDQRAVRYDYGGGGLLLSDDGGGSYRLMCNRVIDEGVTRETTGIVIGPGGRLFTGTFNGMWMGTPDGCDWSAVDTFDGRWVSDITNHPDDPDVLFAITGNGGAGFENGVYRYDGTSDTWTSLGPLESALLLDLVVVRTPTGLRFIQALARGQDAQGLSQYIIRHSDDDAATWTEHPFPSTEGNLRLRDVDPQDVDRIVVSVDHGSDPVLTDALWLSDSGGQSDSWTLVGEPQTFGGVAIAADGSLWWADAEGPLSVLRPGSAAPQVVDADMYGRCVVRDRSGAGMHVCTRTEVGRLDTGTGGYTTELDFAGALDWLQCDGTDVAAVCEEDSGEAGWCGPAHYPDAGVCAAYGYDWYAPDTTTDTPDAAVGGSDGGSTTPDMPGDAGNVIADADAGEGGGGGSDCGCRAIAGGRTSGAPAWLALALAMLGLRRRSRRLLGPRAD